MEKAVAVEQDAEQQDRLAVAVEQNAEEQDRLAVAVTGC
jgi:hypothetical protein